MEMKKQIKNIINWLVGSGGEWIEADQANEDLIDAEIDRRTAGAWPEN